MTSELRNAPSYELRLQEQDVIIWHHIMLLYISNNTHIMCARAGVREFVCWVGLSITCFFL